LAFKAAVDTSRLPAVGDLLRAAAALLLGGDRSAWDRALLMPHYDAAGMPVLSSKQVCTGLGFQGCGTVSVCCGSINHSICLLHFAGLSLQTHLAGALFFSSTCSTCCLPAPLPTPCATCCRE